VRGRRSLATVNDSNGGRHDVVRRRWLFFQTRSPRRKFILTTYRRGRALVVNYRRLVRNSTVGLPRFRTVHLRFDVPSTYAGRSVTKRRKSEPPGCKKPGLDTAAVLLILTSAPRAGSWKEALRPADIIFRLLDERR